MLLINGVLLFVYNNFIWVLMMALRIAARWCKISRQEGCFLSYAGQGGNVLFVIFSSTLAECVSLDSSFNYFVTKDFLTDFVGVSPEPRYGDFAGSYRDQRPNFKPKP
jgi:hypothetical protein